MELSQHQLKLLLICDCVRWNDEAAFTPYNYQLVRRALGQKDPIITFEYDMAVAHAVAWDNDPPPSPPPGPERSPWLITYDVEWWDIDKLGLADYDLAYEPVLDDDPE